MQTFIDGHATQVFSKQQIQIQLRECQQSNIKKLAEILLDTGIEIIIGNLTPSECELSLHIPTHFDVVKASGDDVPRIDLDPKDYFNLRLDKESGQKITVFADGSITADDIQEAFRIPIVITYNGDNQFTVSGGKIWRFGRGNLNEKVVMLEAGQLPETILYLSSLAEAEIVDDIDSLNGLQRNIDYALPILEAYSKHPFSGRIKSEIRASIWALNEQLKSIESASQRIKRKPVFDAVQKDILIELLSAQVSPELLNTLKRQSLVNATGHIKKLYPDMVSDVAKQPNLQNNLRSELEAHPLNALLEPLLDSEETFKFPIHNCKQCQKSPTILRSTINNTKTKRWYLHCSHCNISQNPNDWCARSFNAIQLWNRENPEPTKQLSSIPILALTDSDHQENKKIIKRFTGYQSLYSQYVSSVESTADEAKKIWCNIQRSKLLKLQALLEYANGLIKAQRKIGA